LKLSYEDKIFANTNEWIHHNELIRRVKGDKSGLSRTIRGLVENKSLDMRKEKNQKLYRRNDGIPSIHVFQGIVETEQWNYNQVLQAIKKMPKLTTKTGKISSRGKELLYHIELLMDRSMIVMIRTNYQKHLGLIPNKVAERMVRIMDKMMGDVMKEITTKYEKDIKLVQELFQNHNKNLIFKI